MDFVAGASGLHSDRGRSERVANKVISKALLHYLLAS